MRRELSKRKRAMAGLLSAVLLVSSLPQNSMYVYAAEQVENLQTEEMTDAPTGSEMEETMDFSMETEEKTDVPTESESEETMDSSMETEEKTDAPTEPETKETETDNDSNTVETQETEEKTDSQNTDSEETDTQAESVETEESIEFESGDEQQETEGVKETDLQEKIVTAELIGAYQFGDAPSKRASVSTFSSSLTADTDTSEMEEYLYQQMKERKETINVQKYGIGQDKIGDIVFGVINENPDLYFVKKKISYSLSGTNVISVMLTYDDSYDDSAFVEAVKEALAVVKPEMSDLEKAIVLHDYLAVNCEYDKENLDKGEIPDASYTAYGTLVNRISVCQGYALAYKYLLNQVGIECLMVTSQAMNHAWNLIQLNGKYYQVDVTWDDPTWDLIGRARHEYMFRSDAAFENNCKHHDWTVTEGSEVVDYKATDASYDNAFWLECNAPLIFVEEDCYYIAYNGTGVINKNSLSDITGDGTTVCDIGTWTVWNGSGFWQNAFSGLFYVNDRLYYNDKVSIRSFAFDDVGNVIDEREEFKADTTNGYIYGSAFCQGKVYYSLHQSPNESAKETVLTADITFETEEPTEIPVEKIELDKEIVTLAVGDKTVLKAVITPSSAADTAITWESSDNLIAEVSDGVITAIMAGSCTITASAGGKKAFCEVTIIDNEDVIASGSYENITWKIEKNGKLTVTGTGDFSDSNGFSRAPWYDSREHITSAEINVTGMTDASAMLYDCENLTSVDVSCFDTKNVTDMSQMFKGCGKLSNIDVSKFDTKNVTDMSQMFKGCGKLSNIDVSKFDTANVTNMEGMFANCNSLASLDVSGFHTEKVTNMWEMFKGCSSLTSLDLDNFNTGNVTDIHGMFGDCSSLADLDLSKFDVGKVTDIRDIFSGCTNLSIIYTPINLTISAELPANGEDIWYQPDKTTITELPQKLNYSIKLMKNSAPVVSDAYIKIQKTKTVYQCGDTLNIDDLTVTYYDNDGTAKTVTDYTTNADEIDMSVEGTKTLIVSYKELTASVDLTVSAVTDLDKETYTVTFDLQGHGTELEEYLTYTEIKKGSGIKPPTAPQTDGYEFTGWYKDADCRTLWDFEKDTIEKDTILYAGWKQSEKVEKKPLVNSVLFPKQKNEYSAVYTGEQIRPVMIVAHQYTDGNGKTKTQKLKLNVDYTVRYNNNVNVGEDTAQVTIRGIGEYTGTITKKYTIKQKSIGNAAISPVGDIVFGDEPSVRVTDGTRELVEDRDYNIHLSTTGLADADTQSVLTVEGIGNYTGTSKKRVKFNILKTETDIQPITSENIHLAFKKLPAKGYTYNGKAQKPGVVVTDTTTGKKIPSSMYKVIYSNNIAAGKGTAKVWVIGVSKNGKGYYGKSKPLSFDIKQKDFSKVSASLSGTIPKTGKIEDVKKAVKEAIIVKDAKHILSENEYTIDYGGIKTIDDIKIGKKYPILLRANAGGNYIETSEKKVNIKFGQLNLASRTANVSVEITNALQNEILFYYNGILLEKDKDYTATVKKEKNKRTYTVKVKAVKDSAYKGSRTFKNVPSDQEDGDVEGEKAKRLYKLLEDGIKNTVGMYEEAYIDVSELKLSNADGSEDRELLNAVFNKVIYDHPEYFYVTGGYWRYHRTSNPNEMVGVRPMYYDFAKEQGVIDNFNEAVELALSQVDGISDPLEQILILHDYLVTNSVYNYDVASDNMDLAPSETWNAYGALVLKDTVCKGYAHAYRLLMKRLGINCIEVGSEEMNHIWNMVQLDGEWYHVDVNRANSIHPTLRGRCRHDIFMVSDDTVIENGYYNWTRAWGEPAPVCSSKKYETGGWAFNNRTDYPMYHDSDGKYYYIRRINARTCTLYYGTLAENGTELADIPLYTHIEPNAYYTQSGIVWLDHCLYYVNLDKILMRYELLTGQETALGEIPFTAQPSPDGYFTYLNDGIGLVYDKANSTIEVWSRTRRQVLAVYQIGLETVKGKLSIPEGDADIYYTVDGSASLRKVFCIKKC